MKFFSLVFCICFFGATSLVFAASISKLKEKIEMDFGGIIADPSGDEIRIRPNSRVTSQNSSYFFGQASSGKFTAKGDALAAVTISFSSGEALTGPGAAMSLHTFKHNKGDTPAFNANGRITFKVGAYLTVNPSQAEGVYSGTYSVFLDYQ
ncbi:MAG: DUF4402 domain-containing protein [Alphaproteobacteria bacterium]